MLQTPSLAPDVALAALLAEARRSAEEGISGGGMQNTILPNANHESSYFSFFFNKWLLKDFFSEKKSFYSALIITILLVLS